MGDNTEFIENLRRKYFFRHLSSSWETWKIQLCAHINGWQRNQDPMKRPKKESSIARQRAAKKKSNYFYTQPNKWEITYQTQTAQTDTKINTWKINFITRTPSPQTTPKNNRENEQSDIGENRDYEPNLWKKYFLLNYSCSRETWKIQYTLINAWQRNRDPMKKRKKEINNPLKNAVKRKSNSYNIQQMKSQIKIKNKKKPNT